MTKIDIISGFLGSGKTTLIGRLLSEPLKGEQVVLIENEFGEIGIDGGFLKDAGVQITEMNSGCICCTLVGDFGKALQEVIETYHPARILIEPSGVGKLSDVIAAVQRVAEHEPVVLNSFVTVVDAQKAKMYAKNFGEFFLNQIEHAGAILLSRTQFVKEDRLEQVVSLLREHNKDARIVTTPWDQLTGAQLLSVMEDSHSLSAEVLAEIVHAAEEHEHHHHHDHEHHHEHGEECGCHDHEHEHHHEHHHDENCTCGCHDHHHHHADEVFTSWGVETAKKFDKAAVEEALHQLDSGKYGMILRAKGILPAIDGSWIHFDYVPEEYNVRSGSADVTGKLCVIGSKLDEHGIAALFGV